MRVIAVRKEHAEKLLRMLHAEQLVDRTTKTVKRDDEVLIPIVAEPPFDLSPFHARPEASDELLHAVRIETCESGCTNGSRPRGFHRNGRRDGGSESAMSSSSESRRRVETGPR